MTTHCTTLHYTAPHCTTLHHTAPQYLHTVLHTLQLARLKTHMHSPIMNSMRVTIEADAAGSMSELSPYTTAYTAIFNMDILKPYVLTSGYMANRYSG
jgi:tetrahydromethanopterin S-methyltransferase subunit C